MSEIQSRIRHLRLRARNALWLYGISWLVTTTLVAGIAIGLLDWLVHVDEPVMRLSLSVITVLAVSVLSWRVLIRPARQSLSDVALAMKIERRFPAFRDSLSSTVQFAAEDPDRATGSAELRSVVMQQAESRLKRLNVNDVIETRDVRTASWLAVVCCALVALIAGLRPVEASLVVERFVFPFSAREWPRKVHLRLLDRDLKAIGTAKPIRRVQGETFKFYVENTTGRLPRDVRLIVEYGDGRRETEPLRRVSVRDAEDVVRNLCVANILVERGPIRFRVVGGDDDTMATRTIDAVPAPRLKTIDVTLTPPDYSGQPERELPTGIGHFEALVGTKVAIRAESNTPLQTAMLRLKSDSTRPVKLSRDGKRFTVEFLIRESGNYAYWFHLKDRKGFSDPNATRYDIRAVGDRVPVVRMRSPSRNITATPGAIVELKYAVEDDQGIRSVALATRAGNERDKTLTVLVPPPEPDAGNEPAKAVRELQRSWRWKIAETVVGTRVRFTIEADDYCRLDSRGRPDLSGRTRHVGKSATRTVTIVSPPEKSAEIARKYGELLEDLQRAEKQQRETHGQLGQLRIQLRKTGSLKRQEDQVLLKRVAREQRDLERQLTGSRNAIQKRAAALQREMVANHLDNRELKGRLNRIDTELAALRRSSLQKLQQLLRTLESQLDLSGKSKPDTKIDPQRQLSNIKRAEGEQAAVLRSLRDLIGELSEWRNWHDLSTELKQLIKAQRDIRADVAQLNRRTQGKRVGDLDDQDKADLARLSERQRRVLARLDRFGNSVERFLKAMRSNPTGNRTAIATLEEVADLIKNRPFDRNLRRMAGSIEENHLNETSGTHKTVLADLNDLLAALENRPTDDLETLVKKQKRAEAELETLYKQQRDLADQLQKLQKDLKQNRSSEELQKLIKRQRDLRDRAAALARRLRRLSADDANQALQRAGDGMEQSLESLQKKAIERGQIEQREALDNLEQARRELARERQRNERQLAIQQIEKFAAEIQSLLARQENVIQGTARLRTEQKMSKRWSPGRLRTLDSLHAEQTSLRKRIDALAESTKSTAVFSLALKQVGHSMTSAAKSLAATLTSREVTQLVTAESEAREAKRLLIELVKSLAPARRPANGNAQQNGDGNPAGGQQPAGPSALAQLKLLRQMQAQLLKQTAELDKQRKGTSQPSPSQTAAMKSLADQQQQLADLTRTLQRELGVREPPPEIKQQPTKYSPAALFRRTADDMRESAKLLAEKNTGTDTRKLQQRAVDNLDQLLKSAQRVPLTGNAQSQSGNKSKTNDSNSAKKKSGSAKSGTAKSNGNAAAKKKANDSDANIRKSPAQTAKQRAGTRDRLVQEVWGHLPEHIKQQLRNVAGEKYLPKYKPLINKYFESLSK